MKPSVATFQVPWELERLLELVERLVPRRVLEIGCYEGGTLWHWLQWADTVVAIDDECRNSQEWETWPLRHQQLHVIKGSSHDPDVIEQADNLGPYDLVFIDADHSYDAVYADWINYAQMAARGGVIVFHDILPRPGYGVSEVWEKVKSLQGSRWIEIGQQDVEPGNEGRCGIGVLWT